MSRRSSRLVAKRKEEMAALSGAAVAPDALGDAKSIANVMPEPIGGIVVKDASKTAKAKAAKVTKRKRGQADVEVENILVVVDIETPTKKKRKATKVNINLFNKLIADSTILKNVRPSLALDILFLPHFF